MLVLTPRSLDRLALRIQRAYVRCTPDVPTDEILDSRVWQAIAAQLLAFHRADGSIPLDPELFIQAQGLRGAAGTTSYMGLLEVRSWRRYRTSMRRIVGSLTRELRGELAKIRRLLADGPSSVEDVLHAVPRGVTPLSCYIFASLEGRPDLAEDFRLACLKQHESCPLYRLAFARFLPESQYPVRNDWGLRITPEDFPIPPQSHILN